MFTVPRLKEKIYRGEVTLGTWLTIGSPEVSEALSSLPLDWVVIDLEHSPLEIYQAEMLLMGLKGSPIVPIIRVPILDQVYVKRALDIGAQGILYPLINTPEEAELAVKYAKYPPEGVRGVGPRRAIMYGAYDITKYYEEANKNILVLVQIETRKALENLAGILEVEGIDGVFVGPNDLSASLGVFRSFDAPEFKKALAGIVRAAREKRKIAGIMSDSPQDAANKARMGFNFISIASDISMLIRSYESALSLFNRV